MNPAFVEYWKNKSGGDIKVLQSHGGSTKQAQAVVAGLDADVVTFNQVTDIDLLVQRGILNRDWDDQFPNHSSPAYSFNGFLVRKGNPKGIKDWGDLAKPGVRVIFPNPKTSGNGRYTYFSAWAWASKEFDGDKTKIEDYLEKVLANVPEFDTGGRGATNSFMERGEGDVLVTFEAEILSIRKRYSSGKFTVVTPSCSIRADFPVAVVNPVVDKRGTRKVATAYLDFLYSPKGQEIMAWNNYRVYDRKVAAEYAPRFPEIKLYTVEEIFGSWDRALKTHIGKGGIFDQLLLGVIDDKVDEKNSQGFSPNRSKVHVPKNK